MANADKRNGFQLITSGGVQPRRVRRAVDAANVNVIAPGDAYIIEADGNITRATSAVTQVNGIVEAIDLQGVDQGPVSLDYIPTLTAAYVIGIEDANAEFAVTANVALTAADYGASAEVDLVDTAPSTTLRQSRQAVGAIGDQFRLVRPVDSPDNDDYAQYARVVVRLKAAAIV